MLRKTICAVGGLATALAASLAYGAQGQDGSREMYGVRWHATLEHATAAASSPADGGKPIVWFRVLGDLDGLT
jgi:hypothetical protein